MLELLGDTGYTIILHIMSGDILGCHTKQSFLEIMARGGIRNGRDIKR